MRNVPVLSGKSAGKSMLNGKEIPALLAFTDGDQWRAGIGDPSLMGWVTVAAYFIAGALCLRLALQAGRGDGNWRSREGVFWLVLCLAMFFLGINKQLDLQTWFTLTLRKLSRSQGWYEYRRPLQVVFILLLATGGVVGCRLLYLLTRGRMRENSVALAGIVFVTCFVMIRAASFHHVDLFLKRDVAGVRMNWVLELTGIGLIIANALWKWKNKVISTNASNFVLLKGQGRF